MPKTTSGKIKVIRVKEEDCPQLLVLLSAIHAEEHPADTQTVKDVEMGVQKSLKRYDAFSSDSSWFLAALKGYRRRGVGTALIGEAFALANRLGLAGIRLLTRPQNSSAQRFYKKHGFSRNRAILYQRATGPKDNSLLESET
jgi:GNAT superfamily N-acetyltransferase